MATKVPDLLYVQHVRFSVHTHTHTHVRCKVLHMIQFIYMQDKDFSSCEHC